MTKLSLFKVNDAQVHSRFSWRLYMCRKYRRVALEACRSPSVAYLVLRKAFMCTVDLVIGSDAQPTVTQFHAQD